LAKNPLKRALRLDKIRLAALEAVLRLYGDPDRLAARLPALRLLTRSRDEIAATAQRLVTPLARALDGMATVAIVDTSSQIGSGALPVSLLPSAGLALTPVNASGTAADVLARRLRALPVPVIGRIESGRVVLDLRCLEDETEFVAQLALLSG
jgi:L-seryl-tRNA(Ser) seleniumtransferase